MRISQEFPVRCGHQPHRIFLTTAGQLVLPDHPVEDREKQAAMALIGGVTCECVSALHGWKVGNGALIPESMKNAFNRRMAGSQDVKFARRVKRQRNHGHRKAIDRTVLSKIMKYQMSEDGCRSKRSSDKYSNNARNLNVLNRYLEAELGRRGYRVSLIGSEFVFVTGGELYEESRFAEFQDWMIEQYKKSTSSYHSTIKTTMENTENLKTEVANVFFIKPLSSNGRGHGVIEFSGNYGIGNLTINKGTIGFITISEMADSIEDELYHHLLHRARERNNKRQNAEFDDRLEQFEESIDDRIAKDAVATHTLKLAVGHSTPHASVDLTISIGSLSVQGAERLVRRLEQIVPDLLGIQRGTRNRYANPNRYPQGRLESVGGKPLDRQAVL